ncbi:hypothetical protein ACQPW3_26050 [Actinosynnema sp. CA-248983]
MSSSAKAGGALSTARIRALPRPGEPVVEVLVEVRYGDAVGELGFGEFGAECLDGLFQGV